MKPARIFFNPRARAFQHHPEGMFDHSSMFSTLGERLHVFASPEGTVETARSASRPFGTCAIWVVVPNAEALGYCQASLRDETAFRDLHSGVIVTLAN